ncbi:MAG: hypothetical protein QXU98_07865 [Candidatus Parvarchaeota archaeon]
MAEKSVKAFTASSQLGKFQASLDLELTATIPANTPVNTLVPMTILNDPTTGNATEPYLRAPPDETWFFHDVYITSSADLQGVDGFITYTLNGKPVSTKFGKLSQTALTIYNARHIDTGIIVQGNGTLSFFFIPNVSLTTTATVLLQIAVQRVTQGYSGPIEV